MSPKEEEVFDRKDRYDRLIAKIDDKLSDEGVSFAQMASISENPAKLERIIKNKGIPIAGLIFPLDTAISLVLEADSFTPKAIKKLNQTPVIEQEETPSAVIVEAKKTSPRKKRQKKVNKNVQTNSSENGDCAHHWIIETPNGATSKGICKLCGASRSFVNSTDRNMSRGYPRGPKSTEKAQQETTEDDGLSDETRNDHEFGVEGKVLIPETKLDIQPVDETYQ